MFEFLLISHLGEKYVTKNTSKDIKYKEPQHRMLSKFE